MPTTLVPLNSSVRACTPSLPRCTVAAVGGRTRCSSESMLRRRSSKERPRSLCDSRGAPRPCTRWAALSAQLWSVAVRRIGRERSHGGGTAAALYIGATAAMVSCAALPDGVARPGRPGRLSAAGAPMGGTSAGAPAAVYPRVRASRLRTTARTRLLVRRNSTFGSAVQCSAVTVQSSSVTVQCSHSAVQSQSQSSPVQSQSSAVTVQFNHSAAHPMEDRE
jgi:hypothetical protein